MPDLSDMLTNPYTGPGNAQQAEAMRRILHAALFAGAVGVGARTLRGAGNFLGRNLGPEPQVPLRQSVLAVPVPVGQPRPRRRKTAAALSPPASLSAAPLSWTAQHITQALGNLRAPGEQLGTIRQAITGWGADKARDMPWAYPVGAAAIGGGLYGGYKLTDWLLDRTRKKEVDSELERARKEYQEAMLGQYGQKSAAPDPIDELYEKSGNWYGMPLGLGLLGLGTVGVASGLGAYNWARSRSKTKALEEAVRRRQEALFAQAPRPIMAVPIPHAVGEPPMPGEEDEEGMPKRGSLNTAADQVLRRFAQQKQQAARQWQIMINGPPKDSGKPQKQEPQAPQLPTLAGTYMGQAPQPAA